MHSRTRSHLVVIGTVGGLAASAWACGGRTLEVDDDSVDPEPSVDGGAASMARDSGQIDSGRDAYQGSEGSHDAGFDEDVFSSDAYSPDAAYTGGDA